MSPLPSKLLIWWHEPITSPPEITAIGNFHQVHDATHQPAVVQSQRVISALFSRLLR
jgi:hypothetical protein